MIDFPEISISYIKLSTLMVLSLKSIAVANSNEPVR